MLQTIREKTAGWIAGAILGVFAFTLVFFGVYDYFSPRPENYAARITGPDRFYFLTGEQREIAPQQFNQEYAARREYERSQQGEAFDEQAFSSPENRRRILDDMVDRQLVLMAAREQGLVVTDAMVNAAICKLPEVQVDGRCDDERYRMLLAVQNTSDAEFKQSMRENMLRDLMLRQIIGTSVASDAEIAAQQRMLAQTRDIRYLEIAPPALPAEPPADSDLQAWYDGHLSQYQRPESVEIEYVELVADALTVPAQVSETDLRARYESERARYVTEDQRSAGLILVAVAADATAEAVEQARAKAAGLAAQARQPGADFAALARAHSEDEGSREAGGDLGVVERGLYPAPLEQAVFALQPGQISEPVRTPDGWAVLQLRELVPGSARSFEEVRAELEAGALEAERERAFSDLNSRLFDAISENPGDLAGPARELQLQLLRAGPFTREAGDGIAALPQVRQMAFRDTQRLEGEASDPVEIGTNHVVFLRVVKHTPAAAIPLAEVRDRVLADFQADRLQRLARTQAEALLARANAGESLETLATESGRVVGELRAAPRRAPIPAAQPLLDEAFRLPRPVQGASQAVGLAELAPDRYALVSVAAVNEPPQPALEGEILGYMRQQIAGMRGVEELRAYLQALRRRYRIEVAEDRL
jgi:peptidyl-prolyl cis-trans isomerase D